MRAQGAADLDAIHAGEHEVEEDEVRPARERDRHRAFAMVGLQHMVFVGQAGDQVAPHIGLIIDHQHRLAPAALLDDLDPGALVEGQAAAPLGRAVDLAERIALGAIAAVRCGRAGRHRRGRARGQRQVHRHGGSEIDHAAGLDGAAMLLDQLLDQRQADADALVLARR